MKILLQPRWAIRLKFMFLFVLAGTFLSAQSDECARMMEEGDAYAAQKKFQQAINKYTAAKTCDKGLTAEVNEKILEVFLKVEQEKEDAIRARNRADELTRIAERQRAEAERSARANRLAALALQKVKTNDYTLGWRLAVAAWEASLDATGASTEPGVCAILSDIISDTTAWIERPLGEHGRGVSDVAFSPDGNFILTAEKDSIARLRDNSGKLMTVFQGHTDEITSVDFSPNGERILTASYDDGTVRLWNTNGECTDTIESSRYLIEFASYSPDGEFILIAGDFAVQLWDINRKLFTPLEGHTGSISSSRFSPDGQFILTAGGDGDPVARLWDKHGKMIAKLEGHTRLLTEARFSPDGQSILTASFDGTARLWDKNGQLIHILTVPGQADEINSAVFSPDGQLILTAGEEQIPRLWDKDGQFIRSLQRHDGEIFSGVFSWDGQFILTASIDGNARLFDKNGNLIRTIFVHPDGCAWAVFSPDGQSILTQTYPFNGNIQLWSRNKLLIQTFEAVHTPIWSVALSPDGQSILVFGMNRKVAQLWDTSGKFLHSLKGHEGFLLSAVFSPDGQYILTSSFDGTARLWDKNGNPIDTLTGHDGPVVSAVFSSDGQSILTAGDDGTFRLWDRSGNLLRSFKAGQGPLTSAVFSPDGESIFTVSRNRSGKLWSRDGELIQPFDNLESRYAVFSPDGQSILTCNGSIDDKEAHLWNKSGRLILKLDGHTAGISSVAFSRDGRFILTAGNDGAARLWDKKGNLLQILKDNGKLFYSAAFSPDDQFIFTGNGHGEVKRWWSFPAYVKQYQFLRPIDLIQAGAEVDDSSVLAESGYEELLEIAKGWSAQGNWEKAYVYYDKAASLSPSSEALLGLYDVSEKLHRPFNLQRLLKSEDLSEVITYGDYLFKKAKWHEAGLLYEKAEKLRHHRDNLLRLFDISMETGQPFDLQRMLESSGVYELIRYGEHLFGRGKWEDAQQLFQRAEELEHRPESLLGLYDIAMQTGQPFDLQRLLDSEEVNDLILYSSHFLNKGKWEEARQLLQKAEELEHRPESLLGLYDIALRMKENVDFDRLLSSNDPEELALYAEYFEDKEEEGEEVNLPLALRLREKQLVLDPSASLRKQIADIYTNLGLAQLYSSNAEAAEASFRRGLELDPESMYNRALLAPALLLQNRWPEAEKVFQAWEDYGDPSGYGETYRTGYLGLLELLEEEGITHPDFARARALLRQRD